LGRCPYLTNILNSINKIVDFVPPPNRTTQQKTLDTLFGYPHKGTPPCITHLYMIAWRFILTDFYQLHYNPTIPPFDDLRADNIYSRTLERYTLLVMATAHRTRAIYFFQLRRDNTHNPRMLQRTNREIGPLFSRNEEAILYKSQKMASRLINSRIEHVGKNIPTANF
jgi:hypothetical protein